MISQLQPGMNNGLIMLIFALCGLSLGFQLPNLTLQMQAAVERRDIGTGSALVQTLRMFGSMLGTTLTGILVTQHYTAAVQTTLPANATAAITQLAENPQLLMRASDQAELSHLLSAMGHSITPLMAQAHKGLSSGIQWAIGGCALLALLGAWVGRKLPSIVKQTKTSDIATGEMET